MTELLLWTVPLFCTAILRMPHHTLFMALTMPVLFPTFVAKCNSLSMIRLPPGLACGHSGRLTSVLLEEPRRTQDALAQGAMLVETTPRLLPIVLTSRWALKAARTRRLKATLRLGMGSPRGAWTVGRLRQARTPYHPTARLKTCTNPHPSSAHLSRPTSPPPCPQSDSP